MVSFNVYILIWFLSWFLGWLGLYLIPKNKRDYINNFVTVSLYFSFISFIIIYLFEGALSTLYQRLTVFPIIILIIFFIANFLTFFISNNLLRKPIEFLEKYSNVDFIKMDYRYLVSKSFEIFFQQVLIISLVFLLHNQGLNIILITLIFIVLFGFAHIPILRLRKDFFGYLIFIAAMFSSFFFPILIINFKYGYVYTYILHWLFYTNTGVLTWIIKSRPVKKIVDEKIKDLRGK